MQALAYGSKYIYQTMPRLLTLWLDMGEDPDLIRNEKQGTNDRRAPTTVLLITCLTVP